LQAGEQLAVLPDGTEKIAKVDVNRVTAWERGQLIFDNEPLSAVVARVNRYSTTPIDIADAKTGALRMSGVFNTGDTAAFIEAVTHYLPVRASQSLRRKR
jgi:transmembrane sensor